MTIQTKISDTISKQKISLLIVLVTLVPYQVFAQTGVCAVTDKKTITGIINWITCAIGSSVLQLGFALAVVGFVLGVARYIGNAGNEEKRKEGTKYIFWSVIALFVLVTIWGIVAYLQDAVGISGGVPQFSTT